jgi:hypothetical protein
MKFGPVKDYGHTSFVWIILTKILNMAIVKNGYIVINDEPLLCKIL